MLTGRVPFPGEGFGEVLVRHVREPPPLPSRLNPAVPPALEKIVLHALAKKPEFRFASMDEFRAALRDPERFSQTLDGQGGAQADAGRRHGAPVGVAGHGAAAGCAAVADAGDFRSSRRARVSNDAPTMLAQPAPDAAAIARAQAEAQKQRHEAPTAPTARRPDPRARRRGASGEGDRRRAAACERAAGSAAIARAALRRRRGAGGRRRRRRRLVLRRRAGARRQRRGDGDDRCPPAPRCYDGEQLVGAAPIVVKVPRDGEPHRIVVKKDGYLTAQRVVMGKDDQALKLRLTAKPRRAETEEPPPPAPPPVAATPKPVARRRAGRSDAEADSDAEAGRGRADAAKPQSRAAERRRAEKAHAAPEEGRHADSHAFVLVLWQIPAPC